MQLNPAKYYIDNIHYLPSNGSMLDCNAIWEQRSLLNNTNLCITIIEHFAVKTEANIRTLLTIRRAAIDQGMRVKLVQDKLYVQNQLYMVDTVHRLAYSTQPHKAEIKEDIDHIFFF